MKKLLLAALLFTHSSYSLSSLDNMKKQLVFQNYKAGYVVVAYDNKTLYPVCGFTFDNDQTPIFWVKDSSNNIIKYNTSDHGAFTLTHYQNILYQHEIPSWPYCKYTVQAVAYSEDIRLLPMPEETILKTFSMFEGSEGPMPEYNQRIEYRVSESSQIFPINRIYFSALIGLLTYFVSTYR